MKLIYETGSETQFEQELNEATGSKKYKIRGIFSSPGKKNKNGRTYPMDIWEREVAKYQEVIKSGHPNSLMELNHPPYANVNMMEAVAKTTKLWIENGYVMGESVLLDNPKANQLKTLIDNGIKMAVSTRGVGKVGSGGLVEDYNFICVDVIPDLGQSDHLAEMYGITEGVLTDKEFELNESGNFVEICCKDKCLREHRSIVDEAILNKFDELFDIKINLSENQQDIDTFVSKAIALINSINPSTGLGISDFAKAVSKIVIDEYGSHNYSSFVNVIQKSFKDQAKEDADTEKAAKGK